MAKRKPPQVTPHLSPGLASARAQEKIATLRKYYELGQRAGTTAPDGTPKKPEPLKDLAAEAGVEQDTIRKALKFATTYTAGELEELLALRDADGEPLGWYFVRVLLQIQDKAVRSELQVKAVEEGWSQRDLVAAVQARQGGKKSPGGQAVLRARFPAAGPGAPDRAERVLAAVLPGYRRGGGAGREVAHREAAGEADRRPEARGARGGRPAARLAEGRDQAGQPA